MKQNPMENRLQTLLDSMLAEALNKWSVIIQLSLLVVLATVFFIVWRKDKTKTSFFWMLAWGFNLFGLISIYLLFEINALSNFDLKLVYVIYSISKFIFAYLLIIGTYAFFHHFQTNRALILSLPMTICVLFIAIVVLASLDIVEIQALSYGITAQIFLGGCLYYIKNSKLTHLNLSIYGLFMVMSLLFFHHAWVLYQVYLGNEVPNHMKYMSFLDAFIELIVAMSCLLMITFKARPDPD